MRLSAIVALVGAIGAALADSDSVLSLTKPHRNEEIKAGKTYTVKWNIDEDYEDEDVTISLFGGDDSSSLRQIGTIGTVEGENGRYKWKVPSSLGEEKVYGISISLSTGSKVYQSGASFSIEGGKKPKEEEKSETEETTTATSTKEEKTESSSSTEETTSTEESTSSTTSSSSTSTSSTVTTTLVTVTATPPKQSNTPAATSSSLATASATSEPATDGGGTGVNLPTGAWIGIGAGSIAGIAVLAGMISMCLKMRRRQEDDRYLDIDRRF